MEFAFAQVVAPGGESLRNMLTAYFHFFTDTPALESP